MSTFTLDIPLFREIYTEFADEVKFTDTIITYTWGTTLLTYGMEYSALAQRMYELYTAHLLWLYGASKKYAGFGGGFGAGISISSSVGSVSNSVESRKIANTWAYDLMTTPYGKQLYLMIEQNKTFVYYDKRGVECLNLIFPTSSDCPEL